ILQPRVFRPHSRVVQTSRHRVRLGHLAVLVLQYIGAVAVQHTDRTSIERRRVPARFQAIAGRLDADEADVRLIDIGMENAHGIGAAPHRRNDVIWLAAGVLGHLLQAFVTDDRLEVTHHHGIGMWAGYGTNDVEGSLYIGDPVAHGFVQGIFERARAGI